MNYIVYKTTNLINGRFYVGVHNGKSNTYFGTGRLLKLAIKKYSKENFIRQTLVECGDNSEEAYSIELMLVKTVKEDPRSYNLEPGGLGNSNLGKTVVSRGIGIHAATFDDRSKWSKKNQANRCESERFNCSSKGGKRTAELGKSGFQICTPEQRMLNSHKAELTKLERGVVSVFNNASENGKKGGKATAGTKFYSDDTNEYKFKSTDTKDKSLTEKEFYEFLQVNNKFKRGRKPRLIK